MVLYGLCTPLCDQLGKRHWFHRKRWLIKPYAAATMICCLDDVVMAEPYLCEMLRLVMFAEITIRGMTRMCTLHSIAGMQEGIELRAKRVIRW